MGKKNVAILSGGDSSERQIAIQSANLVAANLALDKYNAFIIDVRNGVWKTQDGVIDKNDFSLHIDGKVPVIFDVVFVAIHGTPCENGFFQGYLDMLGIPYTCCGVETSSFTFNKWTCNTLLHHQGFRVSPSILFKKGDATTDAANFINEMGLPCFVKPNASGSSYGISKLNNIKDLDEVLREAFKEGETVIIEKAMIGKEVSCGVYFDGEKVVAMPLTEIRTQNDFFDYQAKYEGASEEITPAEISQELTQEVQEIGRKVYSQFRLKGVCRIDFIIEENKYPSIIEINTVPGLSPNSIVPQQVLAMGLSLTSFFSQLIEVSLLRKTMSC